MLNNFVVDPNHVIATASKRNTAVGELESVVFERVFVIEQLPDGYDGPYAVGDSIVHSNHEKPVSICRIDGESWNSAVNLYAIKHKDIAGKIVI